MLNEANVQRTLRDRAARFSRAPYGRSEPVRLCPIGYSSQARVRERSMGVSSFRFPYPPTGRTEPPGAAFRREERSGARKQEKGSRRATEPRSD